jgi:phage terminase small subunit
LKNSEAKNEPQPPDYLRPETRQWFASVVADWDLQSHHVRLLTLAAESWDRGQQAREILEKEGITVPGREGAKAHPAISIERDARIAFARLIAQLSLDVEEPDKADAWAKDNLMPKRTSTIAKKFKPNQAALDAWHAGDLWALHRACGLAPWEYLPIAGKRLGLGCCHLGAH